VSYIDGVNRIFGTDSGIGQFDSESFIANGSYVIPDLGYTVKLTGYAYILDLGDIEDFGTDDRVADEFGVGNSSQTYGGEFLYKNGGYGLKLRYANQSDAGDNQTDFNADYFNAEIWGGYDGFSLRRRSPLCISLMAGRMCSLIRPMKVCKISTLMAVISLVILARLKASARM